MKPRISIITITYNSEKTLEDTILSVINQNYDNLEYLIIDGGSNDGTLKIVDRYRDKIAYVVSEPDKGISDAFNKGIMKASGEIIGIINSDDLLCDGALKIISDYYSPEVDVLRGRTIIWNDQTGDKLSVAPSMHFDLSKGIKAVNHQSTFIKKESYIKYGQYNLSFKYMMDVDLLQRFSLKGAKMKEIPYDLAVFRLGGVTNDNWTKKIPEIRKVVIINGGSNLTAYYKILRFILKSIVKKVGYFVLGAGASRRVYYK